MTRSVSVLSEISAESFAPYGALIHKPATAGQRQFYSEWLGGEGLSPVFHVNNVPPSTLPHTINRLERHPHAAQCFVPLDVSRYLVTVALSRDDGAPDLDELESFVVPSTLGVVYAPGVWHAGASVLDRPGAFAVLMWRGAVDDDVFTTIPSTRLVAITQGQSAQ